MLKQLSFITIMLSSWGVTAMAQSIYADIAAEMAKEGINQAEAKLNQLPEMLRDGIDIATAEREFETDEYCLGNVQALVNMGAIAANIMPFTKVWTYEDVRGPVGKLRVMLNGEKIHIEVYCDKNALKSKALPWGDGDKTLQEVNMSSVSALLGVGLNFQLQGIFDNEEIISDVSNEAPEEPADIGALEDTSFEKVNGTDEEKLEIEVNENTPAEENTTQIVTEAEEHKSDLVPSRNSKPKSRPRNLTLAQKESVENIIRNKMRLCWNPPIGSELPQVMIMGLNFDIDGKLAESPVNLTPNSGVWSLQAFEAARRAVIRCSPYELPTKSFEAWREIHLIINPSNMMLQSE